MRVLEANFDRYGDSESLPLHIKVIFLIPNYSVGHKPGSVWQGGCSLD